MAGKAFEILQENNLQVGLCSRGIARIRHLDVFLHTSNATFKQVTKAVDADIFIGWGNQQSGRTAIELAGQSGKPFLLLEDAFIRSYAPGSLSSEPALGLVVDDRGIYYDASRQSRLEALIIENTANRKAIANGNKLIKHLADKQICKYNNFDSARLAPAAMRNCVLVIDQTWRDQSVGGAGADEQTFATMLEAAHDENPGRKIIVKLHPEVLAGKKKGYLKHLAIKNNCTLLTENLNPWQLFKHVGSVYTVSSQLGFDALMAGCRVRCFAMPFYAGWGLSDDQTSCQRRKNVKPGLAVLVDAAYGKYARYKSAHDRVPCDVFQTARQIVQIRDAYNSNKAMAAFYQVTPWKWQRLKQMFRPTAKTRTFFLSGPAAINAAGTRGGDVVAWASRIDDNFEQACRDADVKLQRLEDGFIRSVGLGTNFHLPMSLIADDLGIYYDATRTSRLEQILEHHNFQIAELERAKKLIITIVENDISKYNLAEAPMGLGFLPKDQKIILVPGQVDDDASIRLGGGNMTSLDLLSAVRADNRDAFVIFKPHPDVISGQRPGLRAQQEIAKYADLTATDISINQLIAICHEVHTISSLTGFEALLRHKKVHCYGLPFYAGWGLTRDHIACDRRSTKLSLAMLVFGTLIKYPRYYDPVSNLPCGPEQVIGRIGQWRQKPPSPSLLIRCRTALGKLRGRLR